MFLPIPTFISQIPRRKFRWILVLNLVLGLVSAGGLIIAFSKKLPKLERKKPRSQETALQPVRRLEWNGQGIELRPVGIKPIHHQLPERIEEEIVLKTPEQVQRAADNGFSFELNIANLTFRDMGGGVWYFYKDREPIFRIPKSYAQDAKGRFTNDVTLRVEKKEEGKAVAYLTFDDKDWLTSPERTLPIVTKLSLEVVPEKR